MVSRFEPLLLAEMAVDVFYHADDYLEDHTIVSWSRLFQWFSTGEAVIFETNKDLQDHLQSQDDVLFLMHGCILLTTELINDHCSLPFFKGMFLRSYPSLLNTDSHGKSKYIGATPTLCWSFSRDEFNTGLSDPSITKAMLRLRYNELSFSRSVTVFHVTTTKQRKLARFLVALGAFAGYKQGKNIVVEIRQSEISLLCGLNRSHVSMLLQEFKNNSILETGYRFIIIKNMRQLQDHAGYAGSELFETHWEHKKYRHNLFSE